MLKFDTSVKKIIETIFFLMPHLTPMQTATTAIEARRKLVVGCCGEKITLQ
jgi:hypothetical protein